MSEVQMVPVENIGMGRLSEFLNMNMVFDTFAVLPSLTVVKSPFSSDPAHLRRACVQEQSRQSQRSFGCAGVCDMAFRYWSGMSGHRPCRSSAVVCPAAGV